MFYKVQGQDASQRIDKVAAEKTGMSRSQIQRLINSGMILLNGAIAKPNTKLRLNAIISITIPERENDSLVPEDIPLKILYQDSSIAVVDKPHGMVVYPALGHMKGTVMNALIFHIGRIDAPGGPIRPGVVHRLDKNTSGIMVVALNDASYYSLVEQFKKRTIRKEYMALVYGRLKAEGGRISAGIGRSRTNRKTMSTRSRQTKEAITEWQVIERFKEATLLKIKLLTGRTHQIRVHFASIGHPVLGDSTYGKKTRLGHIPFERQMLHSGILGLIHPETGKYMEFKSPLPKDMEKVIRDIEEAARAQ